MTLDELIARCKCGVHLSVNPHRDVYESVADYMSRYEEDDFLDVIARMSAADTIFELVFFPDTPVGSYSCYGTSLAECLEVAARCLNVGVVPR